MSVNESLTALPSEERSSIITEHYNLQTKVLEVLPANQNWLHVRSEDDWDDVLSCNNNEVIRIYGNCDNDELIAHSVAVFPDTKYPDAHMLDMDIPADPDSLTILTSVTADPDCRGEGLLGKMIVEWERIADYNNRRHLLSLTTTDNIASWSQFIKKGFAVVGAGFDESDGSNAYFLSRNTRNYMSNIKPTNFNPDNTMLLQHDVPLDEMKDIFAQGWVGVASERRSGDTGAYTGNLILRPRNEL